MQQCDFDFELLIHDDASTDGTQEIISAYCKKYPNIIKPIFQTENQYSKGVRGLNVRYNLPRVKGKYIAVCEGDDYWTDPLKLQKQVDFMEEHPDCVLCYHKTRVKVADNSREDYFFYPKDINKATKFTIEDFIKTNNAIGVRTPAMMVRTAMSLDAPPWVFRAPVEDLAAQLFAGTKGFYGYIPEEMAVYNRGNPGAWSANEHSVEWRIKQVHDLNKTYSLFNESTNFKYDVLIKRRNKIWAKTRIEYVQRHFNRSDQFKIIKVYFSSITGLNKMNLVIWMRFILGANTVNKLIEIKKRKAE